MSLSTTSTSSSSLSSLHPLIEASSSSLLQTYPTMASQYTPPPDDSYESTEPQPHPYLHEPLLYISSLPHYVTDENLAIAFSTCAPFRPRINRDDTTTLLSGMIEFRVLDKGVLPLDHRFSDFVIDRRASQRVFFSREGACNTSRASDSRSISTHPSRAFAIPPYYSPHSPSTSERVSTPRKASSAKLHRLAALRSLPPIRRARLGSHPGRLR